MNPHYNCTLLFTQLLFSTPKQDIKKVNFKKKKLSYRVNGSDGVMGEKWQHYFIVYISKNNDASLILDIQTNQTQAFEWSKHLDHYFNIHYLQKTKILRYLIDYMLLWHKQSYYDTNSHNLTQTVKIRQIQSYYYTNSCTMTQTVILPYSRLFSWV